VSTEKEDLTEKSGWGSQKDDPDGSGVRIEEEIFQIFGGIPLNTFEVF